MPFPPFAQTVLHRWLRIGLGVFFIVAGVAHFVVPHVYEPLMPPWLPWHAALIQISGLAEIAGGIGVLTARFRRAAAWGLIALLLAVFPANLHVALDPVAGARFGFSPLILWLRLPFQAVFIAWVWWTCLHAPRSAAKD